MAGRSNLVGLLANLRKLERRCFHNNWAGSIYDVEGPWGGSIYEVERPYRHKFDELARFAVDDHNKKQNSQLVLKKVTNVKEQTVSGFMYYLTMEAAEGGQKKAYKAKVWVQPWLNFKRVEEFEPVSSA